MQVGQSYPLPYSTPDNLSLQIFQLQQYPGNVRQPSNKKDTFADRLSRKLYTNHCTLPLLTRSARSSNHCKSPRTRDLKRVETSGIESTSESSGKQGVAAQGGAESGAVAAENTPIDPDLALIINAWPDLPRGVRTDILAMVKGVCDD